MGTGLDLVRGVGSLCLESRHRSVDWFRRHGHTYDRVVYQFGNSAFHGHMFDLLPEPDFASVLSEVRRVLRPGGRLVLANMAHSERWYHRTWEIVYRIAPSLIGGCRGVALREPLHALGFKNVRREFISQMTFPAEIVFGVKP